MVFNFLLIKLKKYIFYDLIKFITLWIEEHYLRGFRRICLHVKATEYNIRRNLIRKNFSNRISSGVLIIKTKNMENMKMDDDSVSWLHRAQGLNWAL